MKKNLSRREIFKVLGLGGVGCIASLYGLNPLLAERPKLFNNNASVGTDLPNFSLYVSDIKAALLTYNSANQMNLKKGLLDLHQRYLLHQFPQKDLLKIISPLQFPCSEITEMVHILFVSGSFFDSQFCEARNTAISYDPDFLITITDNPVDKSLYQIVGENEVIISTSDLDSVDATVSLIDDIYRSVKIPAGLIALDYSDIKKGLKKTCCHAIIIEDHHKNHKKISEQILSVIRYDFKKSEHNLIIMTFPKDYSIWPLARINEFLDNDKEWQQSSINMIDTLGYPIHTKFRATMIYN
jgi:hypothetical protein